MVNGLVPKSCALHKEALLLLLEAACSWFSSSWSSYCASRFISSGTASLRLGPFVVLVVSGSVSALWIESSFSS